MFSIILVSVSVAVAAVFTALYLSDRRRIIRFENENGSMQSRIADLKSELAVCKSSLEGRRFVTSVDGLKTFLENERGYDCSFSEEDDVLIFKAGEEAFQIDCSRLPHQIILCKGYNANGFEIDWDALEAASLEVNSHIVMAKMHVNKGTSYDYMIVTMDRTMDSFIGNFDTYMLILRDAERLAVDRYHEVMAKRASSDEGNGFPESETVSLPSNQLTS